VRLPCVAAAHAPRSDADPATIRRMLGRTEVTAARPERAVPPEGAATALKARVPAVTEALSIEATVRPND